MTTNEEEARRWRAAGADRTPEDIKASREKSAEIVAVAEFKKIAEAIWRDARVQRNIDYGKPRRGHGEGTVRKHLEELQNNLVMLAINNKGLISRERYWKLSILILVHDSFKWESERDVPILHPKSHASIAKEFLSHLTSDADLLAIVQYHDLGYALYRKMKDTGSELDEARFLEALSQIKDVNLFLLFCIIDGCTASKGREGLRWWIAAVGSRFPTEIGPELILPGPDRAPGGEF